MMTKCANYHEMDVLPVNWTRGVWKDKKLVNGDDPYKWSGDADPPKVGAKVMVYMNGFGNGIVKGYFAEYGWLGVLVKCARPPKWWVAQTKANGKNPKTTLGHFFGIDLQLTNMKENA
jgi:hypothetical protein